MRVQRCPARRRTACAAALCALALATAGTAHADDAHAHDAHAQDAEHGQNAGATGDGFVEPPPDAYRPTPPPVEHPTNTLAYASLVSGGVLLATGIGFGVASVIEHRDARDLEQRANADERELADAARVEYDEAIERRDDFRVVSGLAGGVGLGLFVLSGVLFARDHILRDEAPEPDYVATPVLAPGVAGGVATVTF